MTRRAVLSIDQGTTNSKAILVGEDGAIVARGSAPVPISHPRSGWVEQDANAIWRSVEQAIGACLAEIDDTEVAAIGISNQRESVLAWNRRTGEPLVPVITWQCRRTADACEKLREAGHEERVIALTGLPLDPLFPAPKLRWLLDSLAGQIDPADICLGTVDSWLISRFTGGAVHACDRSNAARTQLFDLAEARWSEELCGLFGVRQACLPQVRDSSHVFGQTVGMGPLPGGIPVASAIGDSHAALFGHGAFSPGDGKATFGTGSSIMTTLPAFVAPPRGLTTTIAWSIDGASTFAFEGNILTSASVLPWTSELLGLNGVDELLALAESVASSEGVCVVPAFVGLGAPHWDAEARALISGLGFGSKPAHVARAAAESIALQVHDVFAIVKEAGDGRVGRLFVDGGPSRNPFLMGLVSGLLEQPLITCESTEASALGAAYLAGLSTGVWSGVEAILDQAGERRPLSARMDPQMRAEMLAEWEMALRRAMLPKQTAKG